MKKKPKLLRPISPSIAVEMDYRHKLYRLIDDMHKSMMYWLRAAYRSNRPAQDCISAPDAVDEESRPSPALLVALDASPVENLRRSIRQLAKRWLKHFDEAAQYMAAYFARSASKRSKSALMNALKKHGIAVDFKMTQAQKDITQATVAQNVALIKSIPQQYLAQVEGVVMWSVQTGRDLEQLTKDLQQTFGVTKRRASLIARDQNNKATSAFTRARQQELGIKEAVWMHSTAGKEPRKTHLANNGKKYDISQGWFDPDPKVNKYIWPGELINCRCTSRSVIPGLT